MTSEQNWNEILKKETQLDFFLNVTVPAALRRNECIPHTLIICKYPRLTNIIIEKICTQVANRNIRFIDSFGPETGDLVSILTTINETSILCVKNGNTINKLSETSYDIFLQGLSNYTIAVKMGKGIMANTISLDLPHFTLLACYENSKQIRRGFKQYFECVIDIRSLADEEMCAMEAKIIANECNLVLEDDAIAEITKASHGDYRKTGRYIRWIRDYALVNNDQFAVIPAEYVMKVIALQS